MRYASFFYLYFMQGVPSGFALTAIANYLTEKGLSPETIGSFISIIGIPWIVQLIWGPLIDRYRYSVVGHYKHWVVLTQLAAVLASLLLLLVHSPENEVWLLAFLFFAHSIVASIQDASVDAMAILITPANEQGRVNAFMRGGLLLGISFGAAVLAVVLHDRGFRSAALIQSGILLFFTLIFFVTKLNKTDPVLPRFKKLKTGVSGQGENELQDHEEVQNPNKLSEIFIRLWKALTEKLSLRTFGIIALSYLCFSIFIRSLNFYLIRSLHWRAEELSVISGGWGSIITLTVVLTGGLLGDKIGAAKLQKRVLVLLAVFLLVFNFLLMMGVSKTVVTGGLLFWGIADPMYSIAAFPILMLICSKDIAGSQFTAYMALINLSDIAGSYATGWLLNFVEGPVLGMTAGILLIFLAYYLYKIPAVMASTE